MSNDLRRWFLWMVAVVAILASALFPLAANAQGTAKTLDELRLLVKVGDTVTITDASAGVATGRIASLSPSAIELNADGRLRTWTEADIAQIQHRRSDSLGNGALWGFGIGAAFAVVAFAAAGDEAVEEEGGWMVLETGVYGAIGAGIGVGVDALIKKTSIIYARAPGGASARIVPIITGGRRGVALRMAF